MSKTIQLTKGKVAIVSDHQYDKVSRHGWYSQISWRGKCYAQANVDGKKVYLHRFILNVTDPRIQIDHVDGDTLNCTDENLRICTTTQNNRNRGKSKINSSGYKGVYPNVGKFNVVICVDYVQKYIGRFSDPVEAARAYDEAAKKYHGEFANLNFPEGKK